VSQSEIHLRLVSVYGRKEVSVWCNRVKDGRTALNDDTKKHRVRPKTSHSDENCVIFKGSYRKIEERKLVKRIAEDSCEVLHIT
jgi:hypothetical protein